jgi:hypothetical protein
MLEIIGLIVGGIFRLIPEGLKLIQAKRDQAHELAMLDKQLAVDKARADQQIDLAHVNQQGAIAQGEMSALLEVLRQPPTGLKAIDALSASVRPVLTYWWCLGLYTAAKVLLVIAAFQSSETLAALAKHVLTDFDRQIVGSIFGFWFLDRSLRKA